MSDQQAARDSLQSAEPIPIAQLQPDVASSRVVEGEVTITWPFSIVTKSIAFKLVESDFRLRLNKGQVRVDFHGAAAKAVADAAIGGGDEVRISLDGVEWIESSTPPRPDTLQWQLKFTNRLCLRVYRADTKEEQYVNVDVEQDGKVPEDQEPLVQAIPTELLRPSTPERDIITDAIPLPKTTGPSFPTKRLASSAFDSDEYSSPAFLKRARVSYGSLFEGGLDPFEDEPQKRSKKRKSRFSMHSSWRYTSRSPSPEPEHQSDDDEEVVDIMNGDLSDNRQQPSDAGNESPTPMPMVDEGVQTQLATVSPSIPAQIAANERAPSPIMETPVAPTLATDTASVIEADTYPVPTFMAEPQATISAPQSPAAGPFDQVNNLLPEPEPRPPPGLFALNETEEQGSPPTELLNQVPLPSFQYHDQQPINEHIQRDDEFLREPTPPERIQAQQDFSIEPDPSLTDFPRHVVDGPNFAPSQLEQAPWSTLTSLPPQTALSQTNDLDNPVEIIDSSSPPRAPSPEVQPVDGQLEDQQPEVPVHADEGREEESEESLEAGYRHVEAPAVESDDEPAQSQAELAEDDDEMQDGESDAEADADEEPDVAGEDYDLRNYDDAQDDDVVDPVDSSEGVVDESDPDEQVVDFEEEDEAQSEEDDDGDEIDEHRYSSVSRHVGHNQYAEPHDLDEESEEDYDENELEAEHYEEVDEDEYDQEEEGYDEEEDEEEEEAPVRSTAPQEPVFISLLSDSEDEDEDQQAPQAVVPPADERDPFQPYQPTDDKKDEPIVPVDTTPPEDNANLSGPAPSTSDLPEAVRESVEPGEESEHLQPEPSLGTEPEEAQSDSKIATIDFALQQPTETTTSNQDHMDVDEPPQQEDSSRSEKAEPEVDENTVSLVPSPHGDDTADQEQPQASQQEVQGSEGEEQEDALEVAPEEAYQVIQTEEMIVTDANESEQQVTTVYREEPAEDSAVPHSTVEIESRKTIHSEAPGSTEKLITETIVDQRRETTPLDREAETAEASEPSLVPEQAAASAERQTELQPEESVNATTNEKLSSPGVDHTTPAIATTMSPPETQPRKQLVPEKPEIAEPETISEAMAGVQTTRQLPTPSETQRDEDVAMQDQTHEDQDSDLEIENSFAAEQQIMQESQTYEASQEPEKDTIEPTKEPSEAGSQITTRSKSRAKSEWEPLIGPQSLRSWEHRRSGASSVATDDDPSIALARATPETPSRASFAAGEGKGKGANESPPAVRVTRSKVDDGDPSLQLARAPRTPTRKARKEMTPEPRETRAMAHNKAQTQTPEPRETRAMAHKAQSEAQSKTPEPRETRAKAQKAKSKTPEPSPAEVLKSPSAAGSTTDNTNNEQASELKLKLTKSLRNDLPELSPLKSLRSLLNSTADFMGVATRAPKLPFRPKGGARDWMLEIPLTDPAAAPGTVCSATLFRPHQTSLPVVSAGDVVLLRRVTVVSLKGRGFGVRSGDGSAWAVFEKGDTEMLPQIKGPPIEDISKEEIAYAEGLRRWWGLLDEKATAKIDKATQKAVQKENSKE